MNTLIGTEYKKAIIVDVNNNFVDAVNYNNTKKSHTSEEVIAVVCTSPTKYKSCLTEAEYIAGTLDVIFVTQKGVVPASELSAYLSIQRDAYNSRSMANTADGAPEACSNNFTSAN